jgi:site-specific recombinase XerD
LKIVTASYIFHRNHSRIKLDFAKDDEIQRLVQKIPGARYSNTLKSWHIPYSKIFYRFFKTNLARGWKIVENKRETSAAFVKMPAVEPKPKAVASVPKPALTPYEHSLTTWVKLSESNQRALLELVRILQLKAYSISTIRTYTTEFRIFLNMLNDRDAKSLNPEEVKRYLHYCVVKLGLSENTMHSRINALKFYYEQVLKRDKFFFEIPRPKRQLQNPNFFNQDEIAQLIKLTENIKHKTMLMLAYSTGMRVSEVINLKVWNVDSQRMQIKIVQSKGKKDRMVALSPILLVMLREYYKMYKPDPKGYLFCGQNAGEPYSSRSMQLVLREAKQRAGIIKPGSVHALRHSFATHLLDNGIDVTMIMKLLGHNDIKTTLRYLHVTNRDVLQIISPLDQLNLR